MKPRRLLSHVLLVLLAGGCEPKIQEPATNLADEETGEHRHHHEPQAMEPAAPLPGTSIYNLPGTWQTAGGAEITLATLRGKARVIALIYTSCEQVCPLIVEDMKRISKALHKKERNSVGFVLASFDPEVDTPEKWRAYEKQHKLESKQWTLLRGDPKRVRELAAVLGVRYEKLAGNSFAHSNTITLLNQDGVIVHRRKSLGEPLTPLIKAAEGIVEEHE